MKRATRAACFALGAAGMFMVACSNGTDPGSNQQTSGTYYVRFQANGTLVDFHSDTWVNAAVTRAGIEYYFYCVTTPGGSAGEGSSNLAVFDAAPITTKTYSGGITPVGTSGAYTLPQLSYVTGGSNYTSGNDVRITITEITSTTIKGTFQGTVTTTGKPPIAVTNGEFYSKRIQ